MLIGYARVSTEDQTLALQIDALRVAGCERVFEDISSGSVVERVGLNQAIDQVREGDILVVWRLDRLGRSLTQLIALVTELARRDVGFRSLTEQIDTTTSSGKLVFHIFGALAEFERNLIRDRTRAGLAAARARGKFGGRPRLSNTEGKVQLASKLFADKTNTITDICRTLHISRASLYRYVARARTGPKAVEE